MTAYWLYSRLRAFAHHLGTAFAALGQRHHTRNRYL